MDRSELLERAQRYRTLATEAMDEEICEALLNIAGEYEVMAAAETGDHDPLT